MRRRSKIISTFLIAGGVGAVLGASDAPAWAGYVAVAIMVPPFCWWSLT